MSKNNTGNDFNSITEELVTRITLDSMGKNKEGITYENFSEEFDGK